MKKEYRNSLLLVLTALIWGIAFVAQREGGDAVGPYTFNCIRSLIGAVVLLPVIKLLGRRAAKQDTQTAADSKQLWLGGISCGVILFVASTFQQLGMYYGTTAGKAGFLTACYILIVPLLGLFLKKKCSWNIWVSVFVAVIGLYFLCLKDGFTVQLSDGLVLLCAFVFSIHILVIDYFSPQVDGVRMSCIQFLVCGILGIFPSICIDMQHSMVQAELVLSALGTWDA
ncbi:MAG: DMT family transporter, partial [Lachnospiraceae bacterium]|nr:DMT family transporter [Lachnospiraceae bacterium]